MFKIFQNILIRFAILGGVVLFLPAPRTTTHSATSPAYQPDCQAVILADENDPYYPLAEEIANTENIPIVHTIPGATACHPEFLIWVASPSFLSDPVMIEFGLTMEKQPGAISTGIITASTIEGARNLWIRGPQVQGQNLFAVNGTYPSAHVYEGRIIDFSHEDRVSSSLTKVGFKDVLNRADYLTFTGHGGNAYIAFDENTKFTTEDIPPLDAVVIGTGSCQTVRPWKEDSIALRFIDQGAAAYSGFVFSPMEGFLLGEFDGIPFRYTWSGFPIGHVIQAQNHGIVQGYAAFPFHYLLGDPRIALQAAPPYELVDDHREGKNRFLNFGNVPAGVIPIRVPGGAAYRFVKVAGGTSASEVDPFYNSQLQMINIRNDKFILLVHKGGELTLQLRPEAPWYWFVGDILLDSLDHTFVFNQQSGGDILAMGFAILPLAWVGWQIFRKRLDRQNICTAVIIGMGIGFLQGIYTHLRLDQVTITSKVVIFSPLGVIAAVALGICGTLIYTRAHSLAGKVTALLVITSTSWLPMIFIGIFFTVFNVFLSAPQVGTGLYSYSLAKMPSISFLVTVSLCSLLFWSIKDGTAPPAPCDLEYQP